MRYHYTATLYVYPHRWAALWGAAFCASTQAGRVRDLTSGEIAAEIYTSTKGYRGARFPYRPDGHW